MQYEGGERLAERATDGRMVSVRNELATYAVLMGLLVRRRNAGDAEVRTCECV